MYITGTYILLQWIETKTGLQVSEKCHSGFWVWPLVIKWLYCRIVFCSYFYLVNNLYTMLRQARVLPPEIKYGQTKKVTVITVKNYFKELLMQLIRLLFLDKIASCKLSWSSKQKLTILSAYRNAFATRKLFGQNKLRALRLEEHIYNQAFFKRRSNLQFLLHLSCSFTFWKNIRHYVLSGTIYSTLALSEFCVAVATQIWNTAEL